MSTTLRSWGSRIFIGHAVLTLRVCGGGGYPRAAPLHRNTWVHRTMGTCLFRNRAACTCIGHLNTSLGLRGEGSWWGGRRWGDSALRGLRFGAVLWHLNSWDFISQNPPGSFNLSTRDWGRVVSSAGDRSVRRGFICCCYRGQVTPGTGKIARGSV